MTSKWNQYRHAIMNEQKSDEEKLIRIANLIRTRHGLVVIREPFLLFDKNTCKLIKIATYVTEKEHKKYIIHNPDLLFLVNGTTWIMEIDGWVHAVRNRVIEKDKMRNERYELSGINYIIINEEKILHNLGINKRIAATADELWPVIDRRIRMLKK